MTPFVIDPSWYAQHWLTERPEPRRFSLLRSALAAARAARSLTGPAHRRHASHATGVSALVPLKSARRLA
jgi:hypothetical protein